MRRGSTLKVVVLCWAFAAVAHADSEAALKRFQELKKKAEALTRTSSPRDILSILGKPVAKSGGGWSNPNCKVRRAYLTKSASLRDLVAGWKYSEIKKWSYLDFYDDSQFLWFSVELDPDFGCSVITHHFLRTEVEKGPQQKLTGVVTFFHQPYPTLAHGGVICVALLEDGSRHDISIDSPERVHGTPENGCRVHLVHYSTNGKFNFMGAGSLYLESIVFTENKSP